eukprot:11039807-Alexandrium_andersonii.AAC.1
MERRPEASGRDEAASSSGVDRELIEAAGPWPSMAGVGLPEPTRAEAAEASDGAAAPAATSPVA